MKRSLIFSISNWILRCLARRISFFHIQAA
nr:MAG TPA: hypothetical protein [Bacteriophage sp.]